ncbi:hypothetical protein EGW08_012870 [Elysia chlorotica]|uniref:Uncharacterized protein n=1 Tax=Elysia chlorotica TaxID=188477 RepID=A0A433TCR6_ELYCH|nr:hypothetical protein EGW08_012870 [Elysia chlorotica]
MQPRVCVPLVVCGLLAVMAARPAYGENLRLYKSCLLECYRCVKTYGKVVFNGKLCAQNCALTNGASIDGKCYPPSKRGDFQLLLTAECRALCERRCAPDFHHDSMDAHACIFTCIKTEKDMIAC